MLYKFINSQKILKVSQRRMYDNSGIIYANEDDKPKNDYKELIIEDKPDYDPETQQLHSWFEDGEVITQKFEVVEKESNTDEKVEDI